MKRKLAGGVVALVVVLVGVWWFALRKHAPTPETPAAGSGSAAVATPSTPQAPAKPRGDRGPMGNPRWTIDLDPVGALQLEGQVVDADGHGVEGAEVYLSSSPPRNTKSEADGTFSFDKLVPRAYTLTASHGNEIGGPATVHLTAKSDPIILHLAEGATLNVSVVDEAKAPIRDADVKLAGMRELTVRTDASGKATLKPVLPGWAAVTAKANGYASNTMIATVGSAGATAEVTVKLRKGYPISGRVVDDRGTGIARAHVEIQHDFGFGNDDDVQTAGDGTFTIEGAPAGSHTLGAHDGEHAPAHSAPVTVSDHAVSGIEIRMADGGVVAGIVTEANGAPSPNATVRLSGNARDPWASFRQVTADAKGAFEIRGLARGKLQARAESDTAASAVTPVDLTTKSEVRDVKLVLDVAGTIAGTVVDDQGAPVAEVQVNALPDFLGGGKAESFALAGMSTATTDGAGAFLIHGLSDGAYRLTVAKRSVGFDWGENGTPAKTGDQHVRIVLPTPGSIVGKLQLQGSGAAPSMASVSLGFQAPVPCSDGAFAIKDVAPGTYTLMARGPDFTALTKGNVVVTAGKVTDLGVLVVTRGRTLTGKVVDAKGGPVAGASVRVGTFLFSLQGAGDNGGQIDQIAGIRGSVTDQTGSFSIIGLPPKDTSAVATADTGVSTPVAVPGGMDDPPPITLTLKGTGTVTGKVTHGGVPESGATISDSVKGAGGAATFTQSDAEGNFTMTGLAEGPHVLTAMKTMMINMQSGSTSINVVAGSQVTATIDIPAGAITLTVKISPLDGAKLDGAMVHLLSGTVNPQNGRDLTALWTQGQLQYRMLWVAGQPSVDFKELSAGTYTLCSAPITGNLYDPRLQQEADQLKVYCQPAVVAASPTAQTTAQALPAMQPLPPP